MSQIYAHLGSSAQCGRCAHTIKQIMQETSPHQGAKNSACKKALPATLNASDDAFLVNFNRDPVSRSCLPAGRS
jgi:NAD(P)H-nitrite reductase large subunit